MIVKKIDLYEDKWNFCQENSDLILASGVNSLKKSKKYSVKTDLPTYQGNYLISHLETPYYIGEAKNIDNRVKQQGNKKTSTFYRNYLKEKDVDSNEKEKVKIETFQVQAIETMMGRKELEEFSIVNLGTRLNKFQLNKRRIFNGEVIVELWDCIQKHYEEIFYQAKKLFLNQDLLAWHEAKIKSCPGIYYVEHKKDGLIYIGESSNILDRYKTHSRDTRFSALRRHIGTELYGFQLKTKKELNMTTNANQDKRMYLSEDENKKVDEYLNQCLIRTQVVNFARYEFEEHLIQEFKPLLNRK